MSISRKLATGLTAAALATCGLLAVGVGVGATAAVASPAGHHCTTAKGKYPPGKCKVSVKHHKVKRHHKVSLKTGKVFKPHQKVKVELVCPKTKHHKKYVKHYKNSRRAGKGGAVKTKFKVSGKAPTGRCEIILVGKHPHVKVTGHIHVTK